VAQRFRGESVHKGDTFQIWAPDAFEARNADIEDWLDEQGEDFDPLELLEMADAPSAAE